MASKHRQEDPWAGFVDVLSNILMVVIFLVVILGISIYAISQQVTKTAVQEAIEKERSQTTKGEQSRDPNPKPNEIAEVEERQADTVLSKVTEHGADATTPPLDAGTAGDRQVYHALRSRETDEINGNTSLSVRSVSTPETEKIEVASEEIKPSFGDIEVDSADAFLTLSFSKGSFRIDPQTGDRIRDYLAKNLSIGNVPIEIRAFAQSTVGSVSEARRIAYYRAMQTRTELLKHGYNAENISIKVRESISPEEVDAVRIFRKS